MSFIKPLASLSSSLLARKGAARPAMRSPLTHYPIETGQPFSSADEDDLGWNDMGEEEEILGSPEADIVAISEAGEEALAAGGEAAKPDIVLRQEALSQLMAPLPLVSTLLSGQLIAPKHGARRPRGAALSEGRRAAFTLRVDAERHLKLRLACNLTNRSAQQLLIEALDAYLADLPATDAPRGSDREADQPVR